MPNSPRPVAVQIPPPANDRPSWVKVGVIAVVGFAVGVAWPRLAGIRPGPSAPAEATAAAGIRAADTPPAVTLAPNAANGAGAASGASGANGNASANGIAANGANGAAMAPTGSGSANAPAPSNIPAVLVTRGNVTSCKTADGESLKGAACGSVPMFDGLAQPRLKGLARCASAAGAQGKLAVVFSLDFQRSKVNFSFGKSSTVDNKDSLDQCLRMSFDKVSINAVDHDHPLYAVFYMVTFTPRDSASTPLPLGSANANANATASANAVANANAGANAPPAAPSSDSTSQVAWEVAIVRDAPRTGNVIARLQRGTKVRVGAAGSEGWYKVQYGAGFGSEGWVYRGSIGK